MIQVLQVLVGLTLGALGAWIVAKPSVFTWFSDRAILPGYKKGAREGDDRWLRSYPKTSRSVGRFVAVGLVLVGIAFILSGLEVV